MDRLSHDAAYAAATNIMDEVFPPDYFGKDQAVIFREIYRRIRAGIECFEIMRNRQDQRLRPMSN